MIAANLLLFALVAGSAGGRWLASARWVARSPRLGIAAWYVLLTTVAASVVAVGLTVVLPSPPIVCAALLWCVHPVSGGPELALRICGDALATGVAATTVAVLVRCGLALRAQTRERRRHGQMLTLAGRPDAGLGGTVIEHDRPAAYVAPDRRLVVTSGAVARLTPAQLGAVLSHERAHAAGRHQLLLDVVRVAATALPRLGVLRAAQHQVGRLVELCADDVAARHHGRHDLATALVTMAAGGTAPDGLVAADGGDAGERLRRLLVPPKPLGSWSFGLLSAALAALPLLPVATFVLDGWFHGIVRCVWIG